MAGRKASRHLDGGRGQRATGEGAGTPAMGSASLVAGGRSGPRAAEITLMSRPVTRQTDVRGHGPTQKESNLK
ncbi:MAG: hypothetical protein H7Z41_09425 [Cytophagales bacterium]|nr:hypothetical protein [Armatimonadota bacterium]